MARIHCKPRLKDTADESYEYQIINPRILIQRTGSVWALWVLHVDQSYQMPAYFPKQEDARMVGRKLAEQYATAIMENVSDYRKAATAMVEDYAELTTLATTVA